MATWRRGFDVGDSVKRDVAEWDEHWNVLGYDPPVGSPAWEGLLADRPDLAPGQAHPTILGAYVEDFDPARVVNGSDAWDVTVRYKRGKEDQKSDIPPTQRPAVIEVQPESVEVPAFRWQDGDPILNSAGDLVAGLTRTENHWVFAVQKNVASVPAWALAYADAVNSDEVTIRGLTIQPHYLLLKDLRIGNLETEVVNNVPYDFHAVSYSLVYNPRTWKTQVYNRGLYEIEEFEVFESTLYRKKRILDDEGEPVDEPQFLDAAGVKIPTPVAPEDVVLIEGWLHELLPFNALPLE